MNIDNLHQLIGRYEQNYSLINNSKNDEIFKWRAVRCFQDVWFDDRYESYPFAEKFRAATRECSVLVDNGQVSPSNGIVKMAEQEPEEVEHLFNEVLFADDNGDLELTSKSFWKVLSLFGSVAFQAFGSTVRIATAHLHTCLFMLPRITTSTSIVKQRNSPSALNTALTSVQAGTSNCLHTTGCVISLLKRYRITSRSFRSIVSLSAVLISTRIRACIFWPLISSTVHEPIIYIQE